MESALPSRDDAEHNGRLILVAEDNETNQMVVVRQLALLGFAADIAESGSRALELWRQGKYALILSDLHMPDMDGYQLAAQIRLEERGSKHIPIVALTADALKGQDARCRQAGMDDYLSKPLRIAALEAILNKWLTQGHTEAADSIESSDLQSNHPVSDAVDLNILKSFIGDETSAISDFVQSFRINAAKQSIALKDACIEGNMPQAKKSAHTLKSSAHYIGALVLSAICAEMENAANFDDVEAIAMLLPKFEHEFGRVIEFIASLHLSNADPSDAQ
jgi:CheY-like chemotaxis protein/HPt (histidine-containing phosphotransfer) domain-containing protein